MSEINQKFEDACNKFCGELYQEAVGHKTGNIVFSPISIQTALSFLMFGSSGQTLRDMKKGLKYGNTSRDDLAKTFKGLTERFQKTDGLSMANKLFVMEGFGIAKKFQSIAEKSFNSEAGQVDFKKSKEAAGEINKWAELKTEGKIKDVISPKSIDGLTKLILVNAIYFKAQWAKSFFAYMSHPRMFYLNDKNTVEMTFMEQTSNFNYGIVDNLDATCLQMRYENPGVSMLIILPNSKTGLPKVEAKLRDICVGGLVKNMEYKYVNLKIPKFEIEFEFDLNEPLKKMGMDRIFSNDAEFHGLLDPMPDEFFNVAQVNHKALIRVDEQGTEAAAVTYVQLCGGGGSPSPPIEFTADHPFMFALVQDSSVLFIGRKTR